MTLAVRQAMRIPLTKLCDITNHFGLLLTTVMRSLTAGIEIVGGIPKVIWSPNLNTNGIERIYTIWGKTNLIDGADWECPTNAAHQFFKVTVEMP